MDDELYVSFCVPPDHLSGALQAYPSPDDLMI
jgi:hypothetical protein